MKTAKLFQNASGQAVQLPKEFQFHGDRIYIKKMGDAVILLPVQDSWKTLTDSLTRFTEDFMQERDQPLIQTRSDV